MDFFILSFFVGYILSFGLVRLRTVQLLVQMFTFVCGGCDNHKCHNKKPSEKIGQGCDWRHARKWWSGILDDFEKKQLVMIWRWTRLVEIWSCARQVQFVGYEMPVRLLGQWVEIFGLWVGQFSWGVDCGRCRNSQYSKNCEENLKVKKVMKVSYLN